MRVLLINDTSSSPNWGARATSIALKKMITDTGDHSLTNLKQDNVQGYRDSRDPVNKFKNILKQFIPPALLELKQKLPFNFTSSSVFQNTPQKWEDFERLRKKISRDKMGLSEKFQAIARTDIVIIQGEGCIYGNTKHSRMLLFFGYLAKKYFNKPVLMVNHTADFSHPVLHKIAQNVYPLFDDVVFREPVSAQQCNSFCSGRRGADAAFIFKPASLSDWLPIADRDTYFDFWPESAPFDPGNPYICIGGGSGLPSVNNNSFDPVAKYSTLISYLQKNFSQQLVLTASGSTDLRIFRALAERHNLPLLGLATPVQQAVDILGNARAYIGGRWHPSIFSLSGGTPIIPITANSFKMDALGRLFGLTESSINPSNIDAEKEKIADLLNDYFSRGKNLREQLENRARKEEEKAFENVAFLRKDHAIT